jgi:starch synthase
MPKPQQPQTRTRLARKPTPDTKTPSTHVADASPVASQPIDIAPVSEPEPAAVAAPPSSPASTPAIASKKPSVKAKTAPQAPTPIAHAHALPPPRLVRKSAVPKSARVSSQAADYASGATSGSPAAPAPVAPPPVIVAEPVEPAPKKAAPRARRTEATPATKPAKTTVEVELETAMPKAAKAATRTPAGKTPPASAAAVAPIPAAVAPVATAAVESPHTPATTKGTRVSDTSKLTVTTPPRAGAGEAGGLRILMIASEAVPFAKTGGLADVAGALPIALGRLGHDVTLVLPRYRGVQMQGAPIASLDLAIGPDRVEAAIYKATLGPGARAWVVDAPALYDREGIYAAHNVDHPDNPRRYAFLVRAAFEAARAIGYAPDVVHAHDWQGGLAPVYLKTMYANDRVLGGVPCVFTIHNIAYTGSFDPSWLPQLDLGWDLFRPESIEFWSRISFLKAGINFSAKVTTVSPTYAREILTPAFAYGFEGVLAARQADLVGILNGIDADVWNPTTDPHIPTPYGLSDLSGKRDAKRALLKAYGLPWDDDALEEPVIGMVSRMIDQKGLDLIASIAHELPGLGARFVVLGTGDPRYEEMWRTLTNHYPDRIAARVGFDEPLSHLVEAGADLFLMPSHYEPCGLNQMYSLRYGTLPLVRATGGLDDTVENYDPYSGRGNGFKFWEPSGEALLNTLRWALRVYDHPDVWQRLQRAGMALDFSWSRSAGDYARLYALVLAAAGRPTRIAAVLPQP